MPEPPTTGHPCRRAHGAGLSRLRGQSDGGGRQEFPHETWCGPHEVVCAVREVHAGREYLDVVFAQRVAVGYLRQEGSLVDKLTDREVDVLLLILRGRTVSEISDILCLAGKNRGASPRNIRSKLNGADCFHGLFLWKQSWHPSRRQFRREGEAQGGARRIRD